MPSSAGEPRIHKPDYLLQCDVLRWRVKIDFRADFVDTSSLARLLSLWREIIEMHAT
jgi:hypothetical protein